MTSDLSRLVGRRVRLLRQRRGWSLSKLAATAGIGKATLSEIEAGVRNPTLETMYAIAGELGVPLTDLLHEPGSRVDSAVEVRGAAVTATLIDVFEDPTVTTEFYRLVVRPGHRQVSPGHGYGVTEHLLVISGAMTVGPLESPLEVQAGGHVRWESSGDHLWQVHGTKAVEAALVIRHPR
jgi:transcriptional regulator with XRE-family HTH domain